MIDPRIAEQQLAAIQYAVANYFGIKVEEMWSERKARAVARPRLIAMYLAKELTPYSLPRIGRHFGNRTHYAVIYACERIPQLCETDAVIRDAVWELRASLSPSSQERGTDTAEPTPRESLQTP